MKKEVKASGRADRFTALRAINGSGVRVGASLQLHTTPPGPKALLHLLPPGTINKPVYTPNPGPDQLKKILQTDKVGCAEVRGRKGGLSLFTGGRDERASRLRRITKLGGDGNSCSISPWVSGICRPGILGKEGCGGFGRGMSVETVGKIEFHGCACKSSCSLWEAAANNVTSLKPQVWDWEWLINNTLPPQGLLALSSPSTGPELLLQISMS